MGTGYQAALQHNTDAGLIALSLGRPRSATVVALAPAQPTPHVVNGQGEEIDAVAISDAEGAMLVGECKWSANAVGLEVLVDLKRKAQVLGALGRWPKVSYILFSKVGFTSDVEALAASQGIQLVQAAELVEQESAS